MRRFLRSFASGFASFRLPAVTCLLVLAAAAPAYAATSPKTALILQFGSEDSPDRAAVRSAIERTIQARYGTAVDCFVEFLGLDRLWGEAASNAFRDYLRAKYRNRPIDVVIADSAMTLDFVERFRNDLFAAVPVVYSAIQPPDATTAAAGAGMTGIVTHGAVSETVRMALRLHPTARRVAVIAEAWNDGVTEKLHNAVRSAAAGVAPGIEVTFLRERTFPLLLGASRNVPTDSILLIVTFFGGDPERTMSSEWVERVLASELKVPLYVVSELTEETGVVGGVVSPRRERGVALGNIASRVLAGARPQDIPSTSAPLATMFDYQGLHHWKIDVSRLPPNANVLFQPPTLWQEHRQSILLALAIVAIQGVMIASLVVQRGRRRQVELRLTENQQRYAMATAAGRVGVWDWNVETNELFVDPSVKALLGYEDHEIRDHKEHWTTLVHPDDLPTVLERAERHLSGETPLYECEMRLFHRDGSIRWFLARGTAVRADGQPTRVVGTDTDITDRKHADHSLHDAHLELARVSRLTALGEFAASIAHEVRQPLTAILTATRAAQRFLTAGNIAETGDALRQVVDAAKRADQIVQRNRQLFRSNTVQASAVDVNRIVLDSLAVLQTRLQAAHVVPITLLASGLPSVAGDPVEIQQVLLNLIANGIDAMDHLPSSRRRLEIFTRSAPEDFVHVAVSDRGVGLGNVDVARMFMLSYTTKPHGTGVGLSISRSIVEAHGGSLWADANESAGATFTFSLPVYVADTTATDDEMRMSAGS